MSRALRHGALVLTMDGEVVADAHVELAYDEGRIYLHRQPGVQSDARFEVAWGDAFEDRLPLIVNPHQCDDTRLALEPGAPA